MYKKYFGFKERPFQLVPNPAYLYISPSHEEALAHLSYAVSQGDGFIAITGETGTGKTTICRAFIENLDDHSEVAYIFNPKLTSAELLKTICDEFGINLPSGYTNKDLFDAFNGFLLGKRVEGKHVMLIIDEAQNLSREVLEQVRLLSNLETNKEKLLQIVLVGQPELDDLLGSYELRQLNQRIALSCRLIPLTYEESVKYIQHRIRIASRREGVSFTGPALRKIHTFSRGIPRLIHIVCDRALLTAFVANSEKITGDIVDVAIRELTPPQQDIHRLRAFESKKTLALAGLLCIVVLLFFIIKPMNSKVKPKVAPTKTSKVEPAKIYKIRPPSAETPSEQTDGSKPAASAPAPENKPAGASGTETAPATAAAPPLVQIDTNPPTPEKASTGVEASESEYKKLTSLKRQTMLERKAAGKENPSSGKKQTSETPEDSPNP